MMFVDRRIGSKDLLAPLTEAGVPATLTELEFGDVAFQGKGEGGVPVDVGVELKTVHDVVSSIRSGRLGGHQMLGMQRTYAPFAWLFVEGVWRTDEHGRVCTYKGPQRGWFPIPGKMTGAELEKTLLTYELCGGLRVRFTNSRRDTLRALVCLYRWFTDRALDEHTSHLVVYHAPTLLPVSDFRKVVSALPGVGYKISQDVENAFPSLGEAFAANPRAWAAIPGIGPKKAQDIHGTIWRRKSSR